MEAGGSEWDWRLDCEIGMDWETTGAGLSWETGLECGNWTRVWGSMMSVDLKLCLGA